MGLSGGIEDSKIGIAQDRIVKDQEADSMNNLLIVPSTFQVLTTFVHHLTVQLK